MQLHGHEIKLGEVEDIVNHIALPPILPHKEDDHLATIERNLLHLAQDTISSMDDSSFPAWANVSAMLSRLEDIKPRDSLRRDILNLKLSKLALNGQLSSFSVRTVY